MAFVSSPSPSSTNEVPTAYGVSTASTQSSTASIKFSTANLSDATVYAFLSNQSNGSQLVHEDLEQIHEDDLEEIDLKWQLALLSMREKRQPRNHDSMSWNQDSSRRTVNMEDTPPKAMVAIDGVGFDWSYIDEDEVPINMALMAFSDSKASKSLDKLIGSQITNKSRKGVGFESYNAVPPPPTGLFSSPKIDLSYSGPEEFQQPEFESYEPKYCKIESKNASKNIPNEVKESIEVKESFDVSLVKKNMSPRAVFMKTSLRPLNTARPVNTARPRPVNIVRPRPVNTARPNSLVVNAVRKNTVNIVKASACWVLRPTKPNGASITLKRHNYIDVRGRSKEHVLPLKFQGDMLPLGEEQMVAELLVKELFTMLILILRMCTIEYKILIGD
nr:hypothetical protein [Tanacetum cinerariifolium]